MTFEDKVLALLRRHGVAEGDRAQHWNLIEYAVELITKDIRLGWWRATWPPGAISRNTVALFVREDHPLAEALYVGLVWRVAPLQYGQGLQDHMWRFRGLSPFSDGPQGVARRLVPLWYLMADHVAGLPPERYLQLLRGPED